MFNSYRYQEFGESKEIKPVLPWKFFWFSLLFTLAVMGSYFFLKSYYLPHLKEETQNISLETHQLANKINQKDRQEMTLFWSQIKNIESLLSSRFYASNVFSFLEKNTLPQVSLERVDFKHKDNTLSVIGSASDGRAVASQINILENLAIVKRIVLKSVTSKEGKVDFEVKLYLKPEAFSYYE